MRPPCAKRQRCAVRWQKIFADILFATILPASRDPRHAPSAEKPLAAFSRALIHI